MKFQVCLEKAHRIIAAKNGLAALCLALPLVAPAQDYPSKPVRILVEFAAGDGGDIQVRAVARQLSVVMNQPVIVENRVGGGGVVAAEAAIRSAPDGYTILAGTPNSLVVRRFLAKQQSFDVLKDLTPITALARTTTYIVATAGQFKSLGELISYAKANPGKISYGTSGHGSAHHLTGEQIQMLTGTKMEHVPYKGGTLPMQEAAAGTIPLAIGIVSIAQPLVNAGKLLVLGVVSDKRSPLMPDAPAVSEIVPGFEAPPSWTGFFGPANLPPAILRRVNADVVKALNAPETRQRLAELRFETLPSAPEEFAAQIRRDIELVGRVVKAANIQPTD